MAFGDGHAPVDMLFAFSATDEKSHLPMLQDLWKLFSDQEALDRLRAAPTKEAVLGFLRGYL